MRGAAGAGHRRVRSGAGGLLLGAAEAGAVGLQVLLGDLRARRAPAAPANGVLAGTETSASASSGETHTAVSFSRAKAPRIALAEAEMNGFETTA